LYVRNVQTIGVLCSEMPVGEPSTEDCLRWLSMKVSGLPDMFHGVNENFAIAAIEGVLAMARDSVDLGALQVVAAESGAGILLAEHDVRRVARVVPKSWWRSFSYDYVLAAIRARHEKVLVYLYFLF
jgi:hypothetical protein